MARDLLPKWYLDVLRSLTPMNDPAPETVDRFDYSELRQSVLKVFAEETCSSGRCRVRDLCPCRLNKYLEADAQLHASVASVPPQVS